jgi:hypothetical protein
VFCLHSTFYLSCSRFNGSGRFHSNASLARDLLLDGYEPFLDNNAINGHGSVFSPGDCIVSLPVCNLFGPILRSFQARDRLGFSLQSIFISCNCRKSNFAPISVVCTLLLVSFLCCMPTFFVTLLLSVASQSNTCTVVFHQHAHECHCNLPFSHHVCF